MAGGIRQHFAADVAVGAADGRLPPEFPDPAAAPDLLHTDRIDLTEIKSPAGSPAGRRFIVHVTCDGWRYVILLRRQYLEQFVTVRGVYIVTLRATRE